MSLLPGCGAAPGPSSCTAPQNHPLALSAADRRDPGVATDGGARAVVAWESGTGGPVEVVVRDGTGTWSRPVAVSASGARDPAVAMGPDGTAAVVWQRQTPGDPEHVEGVVAAAGGEWEPVTQISAPDVRAREPQVGVAADGTTIVAWRRDLPHDQAAVETTTRSVDGEWSVPTVLPGSAGGVRRPRLSVALDGSAAIAWEARRGDVDGDDDGVGAAVRSPEGTWSRAGLVSAPTRAAREPDVAAGRDGTAIVAWLARDGGGYGAFAIQRRDGAWTTPELIGRGNGKPHEIARPGRVDTAVDTAVLVDGGLAAGWTLDVAGDAVVQVALNRGGTWAAPVRLSRNRLAGGVQVAPGPAGSLLVAWEEVDGGLLRTRSAHVVAGVAGVCTDTDSAVTQGAAARLGGGALPVVAYIDLRRSTIMAGTP